jgi:outer membrane protein assembly factor BamB
MRIFTLVLLSGVWGSLNGAIWAADWPGFLGPLRTGVSGEELPATISPSVAWQKDIGIGFSSMAVKEGRLYAMGFNEDHETVWCLDAKTGKEIWTHTYAGKKLDHLHEGGPGATPMLDGGEVYTFGKEGQLFCLGVEDGRVVWELDVRERFGVKVPEWGFSASPLMDGDRVLLDVGPTVCVDSRSGKTVWQTKNYKAGYGSVMQFEQDGRSYYSVLNNDGLVVLNPEDGEEIAFYKWPTSYETNATTPLYRDGQIFVSTAYNKGCVLLDFDGQSLKPLYENEEMRNHMNNSIYFEGHLYGVDRKAHNRRLVKLRCMNWETGEIAWTVDDLGCGSLIRAGKDLVVLTDKGELLIAAANAEGFEPRVRFQMLEGKCWTHPALAHGRVYARNAAGNLVAVTLE